LGLDLATVDDTRSPWLRNRAQLAGAPAEAWEKLSWILHGPPKRALLRRCKRGLSLEFLTLMKTIGKQPVTANKCMKYYQLSSARETQKYDFQQQKQFMRASCVDARVSRRNIFFTSRQPMPAHDIGFGAMSTVHDMRMTSTPRAFC